jgi:hypothetical protein
MFTEISINRFNAWKSPMHKDAFRTARELRVEFPDAMFAVQEHGSRFYIAADSGPYRGWYTPGADASA